MSMFPTEAMKKQLAYMNHRNQDGLLIVRDQLLRKPLVVGSSELEGGLNNAGVGCFAKPSDYARKSTEYR